MEKHGAVLKDTPFSPDDDSMEKHGAVLKDAPFSPDDDSMEKHGAVLKDTPFSPDDDSMEKHGASLRTHPTMGKFGCGYTAVRVGDGLAPSPARSGGLGGSARGRRIENVAPLPGSDCQRISPSARAT